MISAMAFADDNFSATTRRRDTFTHMEVATRYKDEFKPTFPVPSVIFLVKSLISARRLFMLSWYREN